MKFRVKLSGMKRKSKYLYWRNFNIVQQPSCPLIVAVIASRYNPDCNLWNTSSDYQFCRCAIEFYPTGSLEICRYDDNSFLAISMNWHSFRSTKCNWRFAAISINFHRTIDQEQYYRCR